MTFVKMNQQPAAKAFQGSLGQLFQEFENGFQQLLQVPAAGGQAPVNIVENTEGFHLELLAPGREKEQFKIETDNGLLTISYQAPEPAADLKYVRKEFALASFKRSFNLSDKVQVQEIQARYEAGVLKVFIPKKEEAKPVQRTISIQ